MKTFVFFNTAGTLKVEYVTDLMGSNLGNFTVMDIRGLNDVEESLGLDFKQLATSYKAFKEFAQTKNFKLDLISSSGSITHVVSSVTALNITTTTLPNATVGLAESFVLTCPTFAGAGQGDHIICTNPAGETFSIWLDKDDNGTAPTGALHLAATYKIEVNIVTGDTAILVAGKVKAAVEADENWSGFATITDHGDGTLTITCSSVGVVADVVRKNSGESGNGAFSFVITQGINAVAYNQALATEGGNGNKTWEITVGGLPDGLSLDARTGKITGICTHAAEHTFTVKATDAGAATATQALSITGVTGA